MANQNEDLKNLKITKLESEAVLNCLDFEIMILDKNFKIIFANDALLEKYNVKRGQVINNYCYKITHVRTAPCEAPHDPCPVQKVKETGKPDVEFHTHFSKKDNGEFYANVTAAPITNLKDEPLFLHIALPAESKKKKEESIKAAMKKTLDVLQVVQLYQMQIEELKEKTKALELTKKDLEQKIKQLEIFNKTTVGRELRMIELKKQIRDMEQKVNIPECLIK
jgi:FtsZ-binding cell division protein ZapB